MSEVEIMKKSDSLLFIGQSQVLSNTLIDSRHIVLICISKEENQYRYFQNFQLWREFNKSHLGLLHISMLINSAHIRNKPFRNTLQDLLDDDSIEGGFNQPHQVTPYQNILANRAASPTMTRSQRVDKQQRLSALHQDFEMLKKKLNRVDGRNEQIMNKLKASSKGPAARRESTGKGSVSRQFKEGLGKVLRDSLDGGLRDKDRDMEKEALVQNVQLLRLQLQEQEVLMRERKLAHQQKQQFYRELLQNQEHEITYMEIMGQGQVSAKGISMALQKHDEAALRLKDQVDNKLRSFSDRLGRAVSLLKRCGKVAKDKRRKQLKDRQRQSSDGWMRKEHFRSQFLIADHQNTQRKLQAECIELQEQLRAKDIELEEQKEKFQKLGQELKESYTQLLSNAEIRHAQSLQKYCRQLSSLRQDSVEKSPKLVRSTSAAPQMSHRIQELEKRLQEAVGTGEEYRVQVESLRQQLEKALDDNENYMVELSKIRISKQQSEESFMEGFREARQEEERQLKEKVSELEKKLEEMGMANFELSLRSKKQEQLRAEVQTIYKAKLHQEISQVKRYREDKSITEGEIARLKAQVYQLQHKLKQIQLDTAQQLVTTVQTFNDPFLKLLLANSSDQPSIVIGQVLRGLSEFRQKQLSDFNDLQASAEKVGLDYKPVSTVALSRELLRLLQQSRLSLQRQRSSWKSRELAFHTKFEKLEAQLKESAKTTEALVHKDMEAIRKESQRKEMLKRIQILEEDVKDRTENFSEQLAKKDKLIRERERIMSDLQVEAQKKEKLIITLQEDLNRVRETGSCRKIDMEGSQHVITELKNELESSTKSFKDMKTRLREFERANQQLEREKNELKERYEQLQKSSNTKADQLIGKIAKLNVLEQSLKLGESRQANLALQSSRASKQADILKKKLSQTSQSTDVLNDRIKELESANLELIQMRQKEFANRDRLSQLRKSNEEMAQKRLQSKLEDIERLKDQLKIKNQKLLEERQLNAQAIFDLQNQLEAFRQRNTALTEEVAKVTDQRDGLQQIHQQFREKYLRHPDSDQQPSENPLEKSKKQMEFVVNQNKKLIQQSQNLRKKLKALQTQYNQLQEQLLQRNLQIDQHGNQLAEQLNLVRGKLTDSHNELLVSEANLANTQTMLGKVQTECEHLRKHVNDLQEQLEESVLKLTLHEQELELLRSIKKEVYRQTKTVEERLSPEVTAAIENVMKIQTVDGQGNNTLLEVLAKLRSGIERVLDDSELSVGFYNELPVEVNKLFEEILELIRRKLKQASELLIPRQDRSAEHSLGKLVQGMVQKIQEDPQGERSHKTLELYAQEFQEHEEETEARYIIQLTILKQQLKKLKTLNDAMELELHTSKRCFFKIMEILFSENKTLQEDLYENFNMMCTTAKLCQKDKTVLAGYYQAYVKNTDKQKSIFNWFNG